MSERFSACIASAEVVVSEFPRVDATIMERPLRELYAYWDHVRGDRRMPARADIDPIHIPGLLAHLMLVETAPTLEAFRYRLFGTALAEGFGHDRTGRRFAELPRIANFDEVYDGYWRTYTTATPQYFHGGIVSPGRQYLCYSRLTLPLSRNGSDVDLILGGAIFFKRPR